jgi:hypothetical protein
VTIRPADLAGTGAHRSCPVDCPKQRHPPITEDKAIARLEPDLVLDDRPM